jgi:glycosyltransferase involved in cell wall biosynthesis
MLCIESDNPLVSVIIPAYNAEKTILKTIDSVLNQTYKNIEIIVVDDGSSDQTAKLVKQIADRDKKVILLQQINSGVARARNLAIEKSRGKFIAPIDADDLWFPEKIEKQIRCMLHSPSSVGLVYAWSVYIDEKERIIGEYQTLILEKMHSLNGYVLPALIYRNFLNNASNPLIRRDCFELINGYDARLKQQNAQGCEDLDLYLRIAEHYEFRVVPEFLIGYRQIFESMSCNCYAMAKSYDLVIKKIQVCHSAIPVEIYRWSKSYFYNYLIGKSYRRGNHSDTIYLVSRALILDFALALRPGIYRILLVCFLEILAQPVTSRIWKDRQAWLEFRQKFKTKERVFASLPDLQKALKEEQLIYQKPYDRVLAYRWDRVTKLCQMLSEEITTIKEKKVDCSIEVKG